MGAHKRLFRAARQHRVVNRPRNLRKVKQARIRRELLSEVLVPQKHILRFEDLIVCRSLLFILHL